MYQSDDSFLLETLLRLYFPLYDPYPKASRSLSAEQHGSLKDTTQNARRHKEFREFLNCCKLPGADRKHGGIALCVLPEDNCSPEWIIQVEDEEEITAPFCGCSSLKERNQGLLGLYALSIYIPLAVSQLLDPVVVPRPQIPDQLYPTQRYTVFPNFRSPEGRDTGINASSHQPFHPSISSKAFNLVALRNTRDNCYVTAICRLTGELGEDKELKETFLCLSQVRPPEGCTACFLQEALQRQQLSGRPKSESLPKSACSLSYKDFKPRYLDQHTIWENPVSLNKPSLPLDIKYEESRILLHKLWHHMSPAWRPEDGPRAITLPEWIPSCEAPQHQTVLLELQHSFSKTAAQKHLHDSVKGERKTPHR
ncbi:LOW QUALITY PROTEIN: sperm-associated microtubule inner protein 4 [Cyanocitta cristata]